MKSRAVLSSVLALGCSSVGLLACGNQPQTGIQPAARDQLLGGVQRVKDAVSCADRPAAQAALGDLSRGIASSQVSGELDANSARVLLRASERVAEDVHTMPDRPKPPMIVTVPVPSPFPAQPVPAGGLPPPGTSPPDSGSPVAPGNPVPPRGSGESGSGESGSGESGSDESGHGDSGARPAPASSTGPPQGVPTGPPQGVPTGPPQNGATPGGNGKRGNSGQGNG